MTIPALPTFAAIVLHYRDPEAVATCLASLREQSARPVRTVVVDNGSDDDRLRDLVAAFPGTEVVMSAENLGYGAGMSLGLDRVGLGKGDAALFVTQDSVLEAQCAEQLLKALGDDDRIGVVGPVLRRRSRPDDVWSAGGCLSSTTMWTSHLALPRKEDEPYDVTWLDGAIVLVRGDVLRSVRWSTDYFLYFEDVEFSLAVRAAGWRVTVAPKAVARQEPGNLKVYLATRNHLMFVRRNGRRVNLVLATARHLVYAAADVARCANAGRRKRLRQRVSGMRDAFRGDLRADYF